ncbi:MAG: alkaline phosphatase [Colwellia sp.]
MFNKKVLVLSIASLCLIGCSNNIDVNSEKVTNSSKITNLSEVNNVILMIGDGMGPQQVGLLEEYARRAKHSTYNNKGNKTALTKFAEVGQVGLSLTAPYGQYGSLVVDSACSATQLATGFAAGSEMIGLDENGNIVQTILEKAKAHGKATGLVSDTRITHATPAAFAAHQAHRSFENEIAEELIESGSVDVLLSGGARHFLPRDIKTQRSTQQLMMDLGATEALYKYSKRKDKRNLIIEAKNQYGYNLAFNQQQLDQIEGNKVLGLFANSAMENGIAYSACKKAGNCSQPSLREMTLSALEILSKNEKGFFLMIEGGQIDWAGHINDAGWMLHELLKFDEAVNAVYEWVKDRDDTLVVVTADHETGGFGFSYSRKNVPSAKTLTGNGMAGHQYKPNFNFGALDNIDRLYQQKRTFYDMMSQVSNDYSFVNTKAEQWFEVINQHSDFKVTLAQALEVSKREPNEYQQENHAYLSAKEFPKVNDFKSFYVYGDDIHGNLIGRALSAEQNIVWGTGTHTASPVPVYVFGPPSITKQFSTMQHHTEIAQKMMKALFKDND